MKYSLATGFLVLSFVMPTFAGQSKAAASSNRKPAQTQGQGNEQKVVMTLEGLLKRLSELTAPLKSPSLDRQTKIKAFPDINETLAFLQDLKLTPIETKKMVFAVVEAMSITRPYDTPNSNVDTLFDHYKAHKALYLEVFRSLKDKTLAEDLKSSFKSFEDSEGQN